VTLSGGRAHATEGRYHALIAGSKAPLILRGSLTRSLIRLVSVTHNKTAVDDDSLTRHVIRVTARQKTHYACYVLRGFGSANRDN
jgi:hypothetical protein